MSISEKTDAKKPTDRQVAESGPVRRVARSEAATANFMKIYEGTGGGQVPQPRSDGAWNSTELPIYDQDVAFVLQRVELLMEKVDNMADRISNIEDVVLSTKGMLSGEEPDNEDESLIEVTKEEAEEMIAKLFDEKGQLDYIEIMTTLDLDPELVISICNELEAEGKIEGVD